MKYREQHKFGHADTNLYDGYNSNW